MKANREYWPSAKGAALALLSGVLVVQGLAQLPPLWLCISVLLPIVAVAWRFPGWRRLAIAVFGAAWAIWWATTAMHARLPPALEGADIEVSGPIVGLITTRADASTFSMRVETASRAGRDVALHGLIHVNIYSKPPVALEPCTRWSLMLRLKRPRGFENPGGADTERSALARNTIATGYVRDSATNALLSHDAWCIDGIRNALSAGIAARVADPHDAALLRAFTVGDTRGLSERDWRIARANGISHLIAISGFHVGVAALFGVWLANALYALRPSLALRLTRPHAQALAGTLIAIAYAALAGFSLPTVRTVLMIAAVSLAHGCRRSSGPLHNLALALIAILLVDPLAVLGAGFWLSFVGVAFLVLFLETSGRGVRAFLKDLSAGQLLMTVALLPLTFWFFGEASLVGALSNLLAVPFVSFVIVPIALLGVLALLLVPSLATPVLVAAAWLAHVQWWLLEYMATWPGAHWYLPAVQGSALVLALFGAIWLFAPRGLPLRACGALFFLPLLWPRMDTPAESAFQVWLLDVGQGLSVVVRTRAHAMVYDTGARYPSGFDLGEAVVVPSLHALGIEQIDTVMVSHADNDHAGGTAAVLAAFPHASLMIGEPLRVSTPSVQCAADQQWEWDGIHFRVLYPDASDGIGKRNDRSCVLLIEGPGGRILLTGDIGMDSESRAVAELGSGPPLVLQVPHHGSKSSSGATFIQRTQPVLAVVSAGWHNHFGHPRPEVVQRYADADVPLLNTADQGAIQVDFPAAAAPRVAARWRWLARRYWRE